MVILDTFYWYTFNDYTNLAISFNAITPPTGLTWLLLSYLAMSFALFAQNLHMRAFLTVIARGAVRSDKPSGFSATLVWLSILGVIQIALKLLNLDLALLAALWAWITWQGNIKTILGRMKDFKLGEYLTRKVTSYLYNFYFVVIIGFAAIAILIYASSTYGINQDYAAFPIVAAGGVVITFLVILGIRLVFKPAVAIVHIAENAKKSFE
jgi:hypothetical protein